MAKHRIAIEVDADDPDDLANLHRLLRTYVIGWAQINHYEESAVHVNKPEVVPDDGRIVVFTDGGCDIKANGLGAWAYVIQNPDGKTQKNAGACWETTNNQMELTAVIRALEVVEIGKKIVLFTDSKYVVEGITSWTKKWERNGWKTFDGKPVKNQGLWKHLSALRDMHDVIFRHVHGHVGNEGNELCDQLCTAAMKNLRHAE